MEGVAKLSPVQVRDDRALRAELQAAFESAFPTFGDLRYMIRIELSRNLERLTEEKRLDLVLLDILDKNDEGDEWLVDLVHAAYRCRPNNARLRDFVTRVGWLPAEAPAAELKFEGLEKVVETKGARPIVSRYRDDIERTSVCAHVVGNLKELHDLLDQVRHNVYETLRPVAQRLPAPDAVRDIARYDLKFVGLMKQLAEVAGRSGFQPGDFPWIDEDLTAAAKLLKRLFKEPRQELLIQALNYLQNVIERELSGLESQLTEATKQLDLPELTAKLYDLSADLTESGVAAAAVEGLDRDIEKLVLVERRLAGLITTHRLWQRIDARVNLLELSLNQSLEDVASTWQLLEPSLARLPVTGAANDGLGEIVAAFAAAVAARDQTEVWISFNALASELRGRFFSVDRQLRAECGLIREAGITLGSVVEKLDVR